MGPAGGRARGQDAYARRMRTDRGPGKFYAAGWLISAAVMAVTFRMWQLHVREVEQRAEEAERTRDQAAQRRAMQERLRIARELHDSLTHSISVVQVQAGVAVHLARKRGEEVPPALLAIQEAGADAARELRATLQVLRSAPSVARSSRPASAPASWIASSAGGTSSPRLRARCTATPA